MAKLPDPRTLAEQRVAAERDAKGMQAAQAKQQQELKQAEWERRKSACAECVKVAEAGVADLINTANSKQYEAVAIAAFESMERTDLFGFCEKDYILNPLKQAIEDENPGYTVGWWSIHQIANYSNRITAARSGDLLLSLYPDRDQPVVSLNVYIPEAIPSTQFAKGQPENGLVILTWGLPERPRMNITHRQ